MGIFNIFKKTTTTTKKVETGVGDKLIDHTLDAVRDAEATKEQVKEIKKIRKHPSPERDALYVQVYLSLEKVIVFNKRMPTKEYFSAKNLKKPKQFTKDELRSSIRKKFEINKLNEKFRILFLEEIQRNALLYQFMLKKCMDALSSTSMKKTRSAVIKETRKGILKGIRIEGRSINFAALNRKSEKKTEGNEITEAFRQLFSVLYTSIRKQKNSAAAQEMVKTIYGSVEHYGYPLTLEALNVLPVVQTEEAKAAAAHGIVGYVSTFTERKDLIRPQIQKIKETENFPAAERENRYFTIYLELEKFITQHAPPAVKKAYTEESLRKSVREKINIQNLEHTFKLLFLEKEEQTIELLVFFYEYFLKEIVSFLSVHELKKSVDECIKDSAYLDEVLIEKDAISFTVSERVATMTKTEKINFNHDLSKLFLVLYKKLNEALGEKKVERALANAYTNIKEHYGMIPFYKDLLRLLPEGVLDYEKKNLLSPAAAAEVVQFLLELLKKEKIEEHTKETEDARKLPPEEQSEAFFQIYLNLQHHIIEERPVIKGKEITLVDLKERIRRQVHVNDLEDKFQLLFLRQDEVLVKLAGELIRECILNFIDKKALIEAERQYIKKTRLLKDVKIDDNGKIDFDPFMLRLKKIKVERTKILNATLLKAILVIHEQAKNILGESQAKRLFETSHKNLQEKYGANLLQVLKVIPKGILESEKFELLSKEEVEKTAKEFAKIDTMKGEFMNIAAHELKTPLVPIITYIEMLLNDKRLTRDQKEKLRICLVSARREADLVADILDISKLEAGSMKFEFETVDMVDLLKDATFGLEPAVKQKRLTLKTEISTNIPSVKGDRRRLTQVVTNLINNATKFTKKGSITVSAQKKDSNVLVSVADTGTGISKENVHKLFTKFFQVDSSARREQGGTGLGLSICKGIVRGHSGKIWAESTMGKGTTFFFTLPLLSTKKKEGKKGKKSLKGKTLTRVRNKNKKSKNRANRKKRKKR